MIDVVDASNLERNLYLVQQLKELDDTGRAEEIETKLKVAREDALRKLKDKLELYEDGDKVIKFGKHKFGVNKQVLDLTIVYKNNSLQYHLTGTDFYETVTDKTLLNSRQLWVHRWELIKFCSNCKLNRRINKVKL